MINVMNSQTEKTMRRRFLGQFIVADPKVCHGKPTFVGTRIMVSQVLQQLGKGLSAEKIVREWRGSVSREAIAEVSAPPGVEEALLG